MNYDFNLIKVCPSSDGKTAIDLQPLWEGHAELRDVDLPDPFVKELARLAEMPYSDDLADKVREVAKRGYTKASQKESTHFALHSTVRSRFNRTERAQAAQHARFKQHVLPDQRRLVRGRATLLTEEELKENRSSLLEQVKAGILEVRTLDGRLLDLETLEVAPAMPAENPRPEPILDSLANDVPTGIPFPKLQGGKALNKEQVQQVLEGMAEVEGELEIDPKTGAVTITPAETSVMLEEEDLEEEVRSESQEEDEESTPEEEEDEPEELPPGIPPPPPPPGGMPPRRHKKGKHRR